MIGKVASAPWSQSLSQKNATEEETLSPTLVSNWLSPSRSASSLTDRSVTLYSLEKANITGLSRSKGPVLQNMLNQMKYESSAYKETVLKFFMDHFLPSISSRFNWNHDFDMRLQSLFSLQGVDSPLCVFFKEVGLLDKQSQIDPKLSFFEMNMLLEESLGLLRDLLVSENESPEEFSFDYENLQVLNVQIKELSLEKMRVFLEMSLKRYPNDETLKQLKKTLKKDLLLDEKIAKCKEILQGTIHLPLLGILNSVFLDLQSIHQREERRFLETSPLLCRLGLKWIPGLSCTEQWKMKASFYREVQKIICFQYENKIAALKLMDFLKFDLDLMRDETLSLDEFLRRTRKFVDQADPSFKWKKELQAILDGEKVDSLLKMAVKDLYQEQLGELRKHQNCYEIFSQFYFFFSSIYETVLLATHKGSMYEGFATAAYLNNNISALNWVAYSLTYQKYKNSVEDLVFDLKKMALLRKDQELTAQGLDVQEKIQETTKYLKDPLFASIAETLSSLFKLSMKKEAVPESLVQVLSTQSNSFSCRESREYKRCDDTWKKEERYLKQEVGSPFWLFLESRGFFADVDEGQQPEISLRKLYMYHELFQKLTLFHAEKLNESIQCDLDSIPAVNDLARKTALDYILNRIGDLDPSIDPAFVNQLRAVGEERIPPKEKTARVQALLQLQAHPLAPLLLHVLSGAFITETAIDSIDSYFSLNLPSAPDSIIGSFFRKMQIEHQESLPSDKNFFHKYEALQRLKKYFSLKVGGNRGLEFELEDVEDCNLEELESVFQKIFKAHIESSGTHEVESIMDEILSKIDDNVRWLRIKTLEYDLLPVRESLCAATTGYQKMIALDKGFYLLHLKLKNKISERALNPTYARYVEESCLAQNTNDLDKIIEKITR